MGQDMGRGIIAPRNSSNIVTGATEMRTLGATAAAAINATEVKLSGELAQKIGTAEAYRNLVPRDEAEQYGIPGPRGLQGPRGEGDPGPPGPGGSIALEETDPGCFVDSEITWLQWPQSGGLPAVWNPNTETYENPIRVDTSVGTRVFVGDTMIYGDTLKRNISDLLLEGWAVAANGLSLRRENNTVTAVIDISRSAAGSSFANIFEPPPGFRVAVRARIIPAYITSTKQGWIDSLASTIRIRDLSTSLASGDRLTMVVSWPTNDPWPTALPGTPA